MQQRAVNDHQLAVLRWISEGCPEGVMTDYSYKTSAIALRNRGLAEISKRGGWHASITDAGRHYLHTGRYRGEPGPGESKAPANRQPSRKPIPLRSAGSEKSLAPSTGDLPVAPKNSDSPPRRTVPVPRTLRRPHPLIEELRRGEPSIPVSKSLQTRALRVLQALVDAAEREGWTPQSVTQSRTKWGRDWGHRDLLVINTGEHCVGIHLLEENDRVAHVPTPRELKEKERWSYTHIPEWDYNPSGRLRLEISSTMDGRRYRWRDGKRWSLDDKLGQIIDEIEARGQKAKEERIAERIREAEKQREAEAVIADAKIALRDARRTDLLKSQAAQWRRVNELREFLGAMESRVDSLVEPEKAVPAREWLDWCRRHVDEADPLEGVLGFPTDPEPTAEALEPFLPGWVNRRLRGW